MPLALEDPDVRVRKSPPLYSKNQGENVSSLHDAWGKPFGVWGFFGCLAFSRTGSPLPPFTSVAHWQDHWPHQ